MKITLIEPAMIKKSRGLSEKPIFCFQPLALGVLAGLTPPGIEVELLDDRFENIDYDAPRDLVGISVRTFSARRAYQIADEFRRRGVSVILGGHHVALLPEEAGEHADSIFIGEPEMAWERVLEDVRRGCLQPVYRAERDVQYPPTRIQRALLEKKKYLPMAAVETARGCPYTCNFCSVTTLYGHSFRRRSIGPLVDEIRSLRQKTILFVDDNIIGDVETAKELFAALIPLRIRWISEASILMTRDPELMDLMRKSGCAGVLVGIESLFSANLKEMGKSWNLAQQDYDTALRIAREHHIAIVGSFMIGLDHDTRESLDATLEFAIHEKLFAAVFNLFVPLPGTELYPQFQQAGRLRYEKWWLDPNYRYGQVVFQPQNFSAQWLEQKRMQMYRKFYGARSIGQRLLEPLANLRDPWHGMVYMMINFPGYFQEHARMGKPLGLDGAA